MDQVSTLHDWQKYIQSVLTERGFDNETVEQKFLLFTEEVGELAKAIRKISGVKMADNAREQNLKEEIGDVFILLVDICNKLDINLDEAVRLKETMNQSRTWA